MLKDLLLKSKVLWFEETVVEDPNAQTGDGEGEGQENEPFLPVNDRTVYKTREDAIKGFSEAQATITSLSGFKKVLEELGAPKDADANYLKGLLNEYIRLARAEVEAKKTGASKKTTSSDEDKEFEGMDPELVAKTKRGREWLRANAEKAGLVSQEKYDKLAKDFEEFKGGMSARQQAELENATTEGQQNVTKWLGEANVTLNDEEREELEDLIVAYINASNSRINKWQTGDRAERADLIRKGYEKVLGVVKPGASPVAKAGKTAEAGKTKIGLVNKTKTLPQNGGDGKNNQEGNKKPLRIGDSSLRNQAMEKIKNLIAERDGSGE